MTESIREFDSEKLSLKFFERVRGFLVQFLAHLMNFSSTLNFTIEANIKDMLWIIG